MLSQLIKAAESTWPNTQDKPQTTFSAVLVLYNQNQVIMPVSVIGQDTIIFTATPLESLQNAIKIVLESSPEALTGIGLRFINNPQDELEALCRVLLEVPELSEFLISNSHVTTLSQQHLMMLSERKLNANCTEADLLLLTEYLLQAFQIKTPGTRLNRVRIPKPRGRG